MKAEWLASASLALAGVCLGLNMSQPVWNPETEQFDNNPSKGMGLLLGGGMIVGGAVMAKRSAGEEPALVRKVQPKVAQSQPAVAPIAYNPQPQVVEDFESAEVEPTMPPAITLSPRDELWRMVEQYEGGWILDILERPVLIWGAQGSYKSYFAAFLAALRIVYKGHQVEINDPHILLNKDKAWKPLLAANVDSYGSQSSGSIEEGFNYAEIAGRIDAFASRLRRATPSKKWHSPIFDEVSQYSFEDDIKEVSGTLMLKCLSDCRKGKEAPILLAHSNTQALTGGSTGTHQAKEEGLAQLHLLSTSKAGQYAPLFKGKLTGMPNRRGEFVERPVNLDPSWMSAEYVFRVAGTSNVVPFSRPQPESKTEPQKDELLTDYWA